MKTDPRESIRETAEAEWNMPFAPWNFHPYDEEEYLVMEDSPKWEDDTNSPSGLREETIWDHDWNFRGFYLDPQESDDSELPF